MKYAIITNQKRSELLERVITNKESARKVAQELKIKFPSAKSIIRTFKKTGRMFNKKKTRKVNQRRIQKIKNEEQIQQNHTNIGVPKVPQLNFNFLQTQQIQENKLKVDQNEFLLKPSQNLSQVSFLNVYQHSLQYQTVPMSYYNPYFFLSYNSYYGLNHTN